MVVVVAAAAAVALVQRLPLQCSESEWIVVLETDCIVLCVVARPNKIATKAIDSPTFKRIERCVLAFSCRLERTLAVMFRH